MFHHLTLIRLRGDAPSEVHGAAVTAARGFSQAIPSIVSMSCGPALPNGDRWHLAFAFADSAGFDAFAAHPVHDEFVERYVQPYADAVVSVDYDDEEIAAASPDERRP